MTFHNGDPLTADDVVYTYRRSKDPAKSIHSQVLVNVLDAEAVDPLTVRFKLERPQASFLVKTTERASGRALTIVNGRAIDEMGEAQYGLTPVGTGPFRVAEHTLGQPVHLEAFENFYDPERPKLDAVVIQPILESEPLAAALEAGDIQIIGGAPVPAELIDRFQANPDIVVDMAPRPGFYAIYMNPWREPDAGPGLQQAARGAAARSRASRCGQRSPARSIATATSRSAISASARRRSARSTRRSPPCTIRPSPRRASNVTSRIRPASCSPRPAIRTARACRPWC